MDLNVRGGAAQITEVSMRRVNGRIRLSSMSFFLATAFWCAGANAQTMVHFDLPGQPLAQSLRAIGSATNTNVGFRASQVAGLVAPPLKADLTVDGALTRVLAGTGLRPKRLDDHTIVIAATELSRSDSAEAKVLPMRVSALTEAVEPAPQDSAPTTSTGSSNAQEKGLDEIVVTGSHIAGGAPVGSPLITVTSADIENSGYSTIGDVIRSLPESFGGGVNPGVVGANGAANQQNISSASTVNLRGLGSDSTLTLIDGHRLASDGFTSAVDISIIPIAAIERVEILTDSASAIYGSDAIAGVANFILKKDFEGAQTTGRVGWASDGGATERQISQLFGTNWDGGNVMLNYEYYGQNELLATDRSFSAASGPNTLLPQQKKNSVFISVRQALSTNVSTYMEGLYSDHTVTNSAIDYPPTIFLGSTNVKLYTVSSGIAASLNKDWTTSIDGSYSRGKDSAGSDTDVTDGVSTPVPGTSIYGNRTASLEIQAAGPLFALPTGPLKAALGAGYRGESYYDNSGTPFVQRHVRYAFGELRVPLARPDVERVGLERLDLSIAGRYEDYSDFGNNTSPKVGLLYAPTRDLAVRGSWGKAFKAPDLYDQYGEHQLYVYPTNSLGATAPADAQTLYTYGSNPSLTPQTARSWTAGVDVTPVLLPSFRLSATYYNIDYRNLITNPIVNSTEALSNPIYAPFVSLNPSAATTAALYAGANYFANYANGPYDAAKVVSIVYDEFQNVSAQSVHGVDLTTDYRFHPPLGDIDLSLNAAWLSLSEVLAQGSAPVTLSGTVFNPPRFKSRLGLTWQHSAWSAAGFVNYVSSEIDNTYSVPTGISSWTTLDAQLTYSPKNWGSIFRGSHISAAVQNLLNRDPPPVAGLTTYIDNLHYDSTNASALGRFLSLTIRKDW
jgi:iron complex outermembrane receptor protein